MPGEMDMMKSLSDCDDAQEGVNVEETVTVPWNRESDKLKFATPSRHTSQASMSVERPRYRTGTIYDLHPSHPGFSVSR